MSEEWKMHPTHTDYAVSTLGRVKRLSGGQGAQPGKVLRLNTTNPYPRVHIGGKQREVHVLVLQTFRGPAGPGEEGRHLDDVKTNNCLDNLQWGTRSKNYEDRVINGGGNHGERSGHAKLTEAAVLAIRSATGQSHRQLAAHYGVRRETVTQAINRKTWAHV